MSLVVLLHLCRIEVNGISLVLLKPLKDELWWSIITVRSVDDTQWLRHYKWKKSSLITFSNEVELSSLIIIPFISFISRWRQRHISVCGQIKPQLYVSVWIDVTEGNADNMLVFTFLIPQNIKLRWNLRGFFNGHLFILHFLNLWGLPPTNVYLTEANASFFRIV